MSISFYKGLLCLSLNLPVGGVPDTRIVKNVQLISMWERDSHLIPMTKTCTRPRHHVGFFSVSVNHVVALASGARGPRFDTSLRRGKFRCPKRLSLVSFTGMTLGTCIVLWTLTGCPVVVNLLCIISLHMAAWYNLISSVQ